MPARDLKYTRHPIRRLACARQRRRLTTPPPLDDTKAAHPGYARDRRLFIRYRPIDTGNKMTTLMAKPLPGLLLFLILTVCGLIAGCTPSIQNRPAINTVAVWQIDDASASGAPGLDAGEIFSMQIAEEIQDRGRYRVVEREQLNLALEELNLSTTALAEESTRLRLGRLVGARWMIFGAYQVFEKKMRIDLKLVDVETGRILNAVSNSTAEGDLNQWLKAVREAARNLL